MRRSTAHDKFDFLTSASVGIKRVTLGSISNSDDLHLIIDDYLRASREVTPNFPVFKYLWKSALHDGSRKPLCESNTSKTNVSFREMQMKLWGIKKWMLLKNIGKNVTRKSTIFDIKNILVIYDLWFHSDKKIKNRYLNDELIWERTINTTESKASKKKSPLFLSRVWRPRMVWFYV